MNKGNKSEASSLSKRVRRYAKVSKTVASVGARMAGQRLRSKEDRQKRAEILRLAMGGLKGPIMKIAQLLASIPDILPKEYAAELAQLQADAPSMGWAFVKRRMATELGPDWEKKFKSFGHEAAHAASLGQVHRAVGLDGRKLACKLQYPDMASVVEADLRQLKIILALFEKFDRTVSTFGAYQEIAERMREELDYAREAKHIKLYADLLENAVNARVPEVIDKLSTDRLLTMTWLEGERLAQVADTRPKKDRNAIAMNMFNAWYVPFYYYGIIHGDPHLGNYTVRKDNGINLLDFGCVRIFKPQLVQGVIDLYHALLQDDHDLAVEAYKTWGFANPSKKLVEVLNIWARFIYAPMLEDKPRLIEETNSTAYGRETALKVHGELKKLGTVNIPREFVFVDRASIGLGAVFLRLRAEINWHKLFNNLIEGFEPEGVARRQRKLLKKHGLSGGCPLFASHVLVNDAE